MENAKDLLVKTGQLPLKVTPKARKAGIEGLNAAGELVVKVHAAPEDGKANAAVIELLAKWLNIPKSQLEIIRGGTNRHKVIAYHGPRA